MEISPFRRDLPLLDAMPVPFWEVTIARAAKRFSSPLGLNPDLPGTPSANLAAAIVFGRSSFQAMLRQELGEADFKNLRNYALGEVKKPRALGSVLAKCGGSQELVDELAAILRDPESAGFQRTLITLPRRVRERWVRDSDPGIAEPMVQKVLDYMERKAAKDPLALLQELPTGESGAQYQIVKGWSLESALYVAALTGSILHTDTEAYWEQLIKHAQDSDAPSNPAWSPVATSLAQIRFPVEGHVESIGNALQAGARSPILPVFRRLRASVENPTSGATAPELARQVRSAQKQIESSWAEPATEDRMAVKLHLQVPATGFGRHEVQRLLIMFANAERFRPVPFALKLEFLD